MVVSLKFILLALLTVTLVVSDSSDESDDCDSECNDSDQEEGSVENTVVIVILPQAEQAPPEEPPATPTPPTVAPSQTPAPSPPMEATRCKVGERCCKDGKICKGINCKGGCTCAKKCGNGGIVSAVICEGQSGLLKCPKGKAIQVISAIYGRQSGDLCQNDNMPSINYNVTCIRDVTLLLGKGCNNEAVCPIESCNALAGDPCPGTFKYLSIQYRCYITINRVKPTQSAFVIKR